MTVSRWLIVILGGASLLAFAGGEAVSRAQPGGTVVAQRCVTELPSADCLWVGVGTLRMPLGGEPFLEIGRRLLALESTVEAAAHPEDADGEARAWVYDGDRVTRIVTHSGVQVDLGTAFVVEPDPWNRPDQHRATFRWVGIVLALVTLVLVLLRSPTRRLALADFARRTLYTWRTEPDTPSHAVRRVGILLAVAVGLVLAAAAAVQAAGYDDICTPTAPAAANIAPALSLLAFLAALTANLYALVGAARERTAQSVLVWIGSGAVIAFVIFPAALVTAVGCDAS